MFLRPDVIHLVRQHGVRLRQPTVLAAILGSDANLFAK